MHSEGEQVLILVINFPAPWPEVSVSLQSIVLGWAFPGSGRLRKYAGTRRGRVLFPHCLTCPLNASDWWRQILEGKMDWCVCWVVRVPEEAQKCVG